jgi:hypothetical protein
MMYRRSPTSFSLPEHTIPKGAHVSLDVRAGKLQIVKAIGSMKVAVAEYEIHNQDTALDFFAYLTRHRDRFVSVRLT